MSVQESSSITYPATPNTEGENKEIYQSKIKKKQRNKKMGNVYFKADHQDSQKQSKLSEFWKASSNSDCSDSKIKKSSFLNDLQAKKLEDELETKNKLIDKLKNERDIAQKKYNKLVTDRESYQNPAKIIIKESLLAIQEMKRKERGKIMPEYGYFRQNTFIEGSYIKDLKQKIEKKMQEINKLKIQGGKKEKKEEEIRFKERFFQKQLNELCIQLKEREKNITAYKERLKNWEKQTNCHYSRLGWPVVAQRFQTLQLLGSGGFGEVYKCFDLDENCQVALKENKLNTVGPRSQENRRQFLKHVNREVKIQKSLNHPNIAKLIEVLNVDGSEVSFVLEYCSGPELSKYLKKNTCLQEKQAKQIIRQIIYALKYMYEQDNKIIHYDLKPSNIMFHHGVVKLLDFGLCKQMDSEDTKIDLTSQGVGTYWYLPPETFRDFDNDVCSKVDIWSAGVIFYELLYGKRPFGHGISQRKIFNQGIILREAIKVEFPEQTPLKYKVSEGAKKFIKACLKYEQEDRLNPEEAYNHQYFK